MTRRVITLRSCKHFLDAWMSLFCFQVVPFRYNSQTLFWNFTTWCLFMLCRFRLTRFNMHSQRNRINSFGQDWRKRLLHLWENDWNIPGVEIFCVFIFQKFWLFQPVRNIKYWGNGSGVCTKRNWLSVRGEESSNKWPKGTDVVARYQSTSFEPGPNCVPRVITCIRSRRDLKRTMWVFCNSTSLNSLLFWKRLCLKRIVLRPQNLQEVASSKKAFDLRIFSQESSKLI